MSEIIPLENTPNQSLSVTVGDFIFDIIIKSVPNMSVMSLDVNGTTVVSSFRILPGVPIIPFRYLEEDYGNFIFINDATVPGEFPVYSDFGSKFNLLYFSSEELGEIRG